MSDLIDRQAAIDAAIEATDSWEGFCSIGRQKRIENYINSLPFAPGMDCISRRAAIDICANVIDLFREQFGAGVLVVIKESIEKLPSAQLGTNLAEVGTDCISRQDAIDALRNYLVGKNVPCDGTMMARLIENEVISKLPSIKPHRGRWLKLDMHRGMADHKCTACEQECYVPTCMGEPMYAFCPNCGADMRGEQDG